MKISVIVPVYNEEKTVKKVINTLLLSPLVSEIICINDGSLDNSLAVLKSFGQKIIIVNFRNNQGKGKAVAAGIKKAKGDFLFFCDSDLHHFTANHVKELLTPIIKGRVSSVFGVPTQDKNGKYGRHEIYLAGERVYPRSLLLPHVSKLSRSKGAGASEVFLNTLVSKKEVKIIPLVGLIKPSKEKKWATQIALRQYLLSAIGILQEIGRIEIHSASDLKKLQNLVQVDTFEGLIEKINDLKNGKMKSVLQKYFLKYVSKYFKGVLE